MLQMADDNPFPEARRYTTPPVAGPAIIEPIFRIDIIFYFSQGNYGSESYLSERNFQGF
jgi:hypothetical protein